MNIVVSIITVAVVIACMVIVVVRTGVIETEYINVNAKAMESIELETKNHERLNRTIERANENFGAYDQQIKEITNRLDAIVADIERIDRAEKEIRSYYVNFREPKDDVDESVSEQ